MEQAIKHLLDKNPLTRERCERITVALYLITDLMPDNEPLRTEIRLHTLSLFEKTLSDTVLLADTLRILQSLIEVGHGIGLISDMNYGLVHDEITALLSGAGEQPSFSGDFFKVSERKDFQQETYTSVKSKRYSGAKTQRRQASADLPDTSVRRRKIITLLEEHPVLSIREIREKIEGVSEKTLQRDLRELEARGRINREGERRWTRYTLATGSGQ